MCNKAVNTCVFAFDFVPECYKTQEICYIVIFKIPFNAKILSW